MISLRDEYPGEFVWLLSALDPQTPMERLEAIERVEELIQSWLDGEMVVIHTRKPIIMYGSTTKAKSQFFIWDTAQQSEEGADHDHDGKGTA